MKRKKIFGILLGEGILGYLLFIQNISFPCPCKTIFHIPCPGCGMTRAFKALFQLELLKSFHYHVLSIPIFLLIVGINFYLIKDLVKNTEQTKSILKKIFQSPLLWTILIIMSEIFNVLRGI